MIENKIKYEKVKILTVSKCNGSLTVEKEEEKFNDYEIYGFLKVYLKIMEDRFKDTFVVDKE